MPAGIAIISLQAFSFINPKNTVLLKNKYIFKECMISFFSKNLFWSQAPYIFLILTFGFVLLLFYKPLMSIIPFPLLLFCFYFFRNPDRTWSAHKHAIISPADGKIVAIDTVSDSDEFAHKISIFLSPLDVHVNWIPSGGKVEKTFYRKGTFYPAFLPKSSELNEAQDVYIRTDDDQKYMIRQIAGTIARRICCWIKEGDSVKTGTKYGMIKFSSRVDLFLPKNCILHDLNIGMRVTGGKTVLGSWSWDSL